MKKFIPISSVILSLLLPATLIRAAVTDTGQSDCYGASGQISCPAEGARYYGQDAQYGVGVSQYKDNGDGTVSDLTTGLTWSRAVAAQKVTLGQAQRIAAGMTRGGYTDWRVPTIKELYSLIDFRGNTGFSRSGSFSAVPANAIPFINTDYFDFLYGNTASGERYIDAQWLSSTRYVSTTMNGDATLFGVNFADGRIKGYGLNNPRRGTEKTFYTRYVRGKAYGDNQFVDNGDGTVTDQSSGLMWVQADSGKAMSWEQALKYAEGMEYAGYGDWRLPDAKELQYIVDYTRSPDSSNSPAINPVFKTSAITNEAGKKDYPYFWTSTTHVDGPRPGNRAAYIAFGRALGEMRGRIMDVHGAGSQRSDPKEGSAGSEGPQGDILRVDNYVRLVRGGETATVAAAPGAGQYPNNNGDYIPQGGPQGISQGTLQRSNASGFQNGRVPSQGMMPDGGEAMIARGGFVQRLDRDGDGRVSRAEFDGPSDRFDFHDENGDGYLAEGEAPTGPPPGGRRPRQ